MFWRRRTRSSEDFAREIASHLELERDRLIADGMDPEEARTAARRTFGNVTRAAETFYESRRVLWLDHLGHDVRYALRSMRRAPVACLVAIASLAAGLGATTATLTLRNAIFYNPPPLYQDPEQLSRITVSTPGRSRGQVPGRLFDRWAADRETGRRIAAATPARPVDMRANDRLESVRLRAVTPGLFPLLGVPPALGRTFASANSPDEPPPLILSHRVWKNVFEGRDDILGTVAWIDRQPYTITGVMPERFWFASTLSPVWTTLRADAVANEPGVEVVVRRPAGLSPAALADQLLSAARVVAREEGDGSGDIRVLVSRVGGTSLGDQLAVVIPWLIGVAVLMTLLIACANVAILMFARWTGREREMAVRSSLGASRGRIIGLLLTESVVLASFGGLLAVCATFALRGLLVRNSPGATDFDLSIDWVILAQAALATLLAGVLSGVAPAVYETRRLQTNPLRLLASSDRVRQRWRHALVVLEISVSVALMVVAAAQVDASRRMLTSDVGFSTGPLLTARVENPAGVEIDRVLDAVRQVPGVVSAAAGTGVPMAMAAPVDRVAANGSMAIPVERVSISPGYFTTLDVRLRAGRWLDDADGSGGARVAMVNETLARQLWPDGEALGARLVIGGTAHDIVGVVAGYSGSPLRQPTPRFYLPMSRTERPLRLQVVVRAADDPLTGVRAVRQQIRSLGGTYTVSSAFTLQQVIEAGAGEILALTYAMSPLLGIGIFLTATGIFGVLAFAIARRSRELALRVALGATRLSVGRQVVAQTLGLLLIGSALGVGVTFGLTRLVRAAGGGGSAFDTPGWEAFAIPVLIVIAVGALATWVPARRALRIDPAVLLRTE